MNQKIFQNCSVRVLQSTIIIYCFVLLKFLWWLLHRNDSVIKNLMIKHVYLMMDYFRAKFGASNSCSLKVINISHPIKTDLNKFNIFNTQKIHSEIVFETRTTKTDFNNLKTSPRVRWRNAESTQKALFESDSGETFHLAIYSVLIDFIT